MFEALTIVLVKLDVACASMAAGGRLTVLLEYRLPVFGLHCTTLFKSSSRYSCLARNVGTI
eukprot:4122092-Prorocentrum_lima.AAC.1